MFYVNKIVGWCASPVGLTFAGLMLALIPCLFGWRRLARWVLALVFAWLWIWATPFMSWVVGASLEREFLVDGKMPRIESFSQADAILLLGGGMGGDTNICAYAEMWASADRVWQAARLYKAGKAPKIYASGGHVEMTTSRLLQDLGVPREAIVFEEEPRNTEEEARLMKEKQALHSPPPPLASTSAKSKILLVTRVRIIHLGLT